MAHQPLFERKQHQRYAVDKFDLRSKTDRFLGWSKTKGGKCAAKFKKCPRIP